VILDRLIRKEFDRVFSKWLEKYQNIFKTIKKIIIRAKCLKIIDYNSRGKIYVTTNISLIGTEAIFNVRHI